MFPTNSGAYPSGVAADSSGFVYVGEYNGSAVAKFDPVLVSFKLYLE